MAFKLRVAFTGLCAFVPNQRRDAKVKMCVVLPDARLPSGRPRVGVDGMPLRRHRGFIQLKVSQISGIPESLKDRDADVISYLERHRVSFNCTPAEGQQLPPFRLGSTGELASLDRMVPGFAEPDPDIVENIPPSTVLAQVLLHVGQLVGNQDENRVARWAFPRSLSFPSFEGPLTSEIILEVPDLEEVELIASPFEEGGESASWKLTSAHGEDVTVLFANLCEDNPLRWETRAEIQPDEDFRWFYTLLSNGNQSELLTRLGGLTFPIPMPSIGVPNGEGRNCFPVSTAARSFDLDASLPGQRNRQPRAVEIPQISLPAQKNNSTSRVQSGGRFLVQLGPAEVSPMRARASGLERVGGGTFQGEFGFQVSDLRGTLATVDLTHLGLVRACQ